MTYLHLSFEHKFTFKKSVRVSGYGLDGSGFVCRLVQEIFLCKGPDWLWLESGYLFNYYWAAKR